MAKQSTNPIIINDIQSISTKQLRELGFFNSDGYKSEPLITYCKNVGLRSIQEVGTKNVTVSLQDGNCYVEFGYLVDGKPITCKFDLIKIPSNLGKGHLWYFKCPTTDELCRKLYFYGNHYVSRKSIKGAIYKRQAKSKRFRLDDKTHYQLNRLTDIILEGRHRSFKRNYKGDFTKKFLALREAVRKVNEMNNLL